MAKETMQVAYRKSNVVNEVDALKGGASYNIISPKPSIEAIAAESESIGGDKDAGRFLFSVGDEQITAKVYWSALVISIAVVLLFILAVKQGWIKL